MLPILAALVFLVLLAAGTLWMLARRKQAQTGVPAGARVVYADTGAWEKVERPLFSRRYRLTGKPDYIVEQDGDKIPIEVKPNRRAATPRDSDVMQLAAYGLLMQETYGSRPPHGLLKYRDVVFQIDFTDQLVDQLLNLVEAVREDLGARDVARSHPDAWKCSSCGYRSACGQALTE